MWLPASIKQLCSMTRFYRHHPLIRKRVSDRLQALNTHQPLLSMSLGGHGRACEGRHPLPAVATFSPRFSVSKHVERQAQVKQAF
jgi:hypothetical protein